MCWCMKREDGPTTTAVVELPMSRPHEPHQAAAGRAGRPARRVSAAAVPEYRRQPWPYWVALSVLCRNAAECRLLSNEWLAPMIVSAV